MSKSEMKKLFKRLDESYDQMMFSHKKGKYEICETDTDITVILYEDKPFFLLKDEMAIPSLKMFLDKDVRKLPNSVTVDMGAIPFVTNGADIMRPGIVDADKNILEGSFVVICDEKHGKPLAIGISLYSGEEMLSLKEGKVVKNIHYVGDKIWNLEI